MKTQEFVVAHTDGSVTFVTESISDNGRIYRYAQEWDAGAQGEVYDLTDEEFEQLKQAAGRA